MTIAEALSLQEGDQVRSNSVGRIYTVKGITLDAGIGRNRHIYIGVLSCGALRTLLHEWLEVIKPEGQRQS